MVACRVASASASSRNAGRVSRDPRGGRQQKVFHFEIGVRARESCPSHNESRPSCIDTETTTGNVVLALRYQQVRACGGCILCNGQGWHFFCCTYRRYRTYHHRRVQRVSLSSKDCSHGLMRSPPDTPCWCSRRRQSKDRKSVV